MRTIKYPIIGQQAVVEGYGLGKVISFNDKSPHTFIEVRFDISRQILKFDPKNVILIKLDFIWAN